MLTRAELERDQPHAVACLRRAIARGRLPHAIVLASPGAVGEDELARMLAQSLLCGQPTAPLEPCGTCRACIAFERGVHADFHEVRPKGLLRAIKTEDMLALIQALQATSLGGGAKVAVIAQAETLRKESANRFLKTLEEPTPETYFILITTRPERLLPTIRSRCQLLRLQPLTAEALATRVAALIGAGNADVELICAVARGRWNRAEQLVEQRDAYRATVRALLTLLSKRDDVCAAAVEFGRNCAAAFKSDRAVFEERMRDDMRTHAESWKDYEPSVRREMLRAFEAEQEAAHAAYERDRKAGLFETMLDIWRDVWLYRCLGADAPLLHRAYTTEISRLAQIYSAAEILRCIRDLELVRGPTVYLNARLDVVLQGALAGATQPIQEYVPLRRAIAATGL